MLEEILHVVTETKSIDDTILISKDESAFDIGKKFNCIEICYEDESGVNNAVSLADSGIFNNGILRSVVFPQDIPIMTIQDIDSRFNFDKNERSVVVVPSRQFDGTNALVRTLNDIMKTRYDEGSYAFQFESAMMNTSHYSLALIQRIMLDIDSYEDVNFVIQNNNKP